MALDKEAEIGKCLLLRDGKGRQIQGYREWRNRSEDLMVILKIGTVVKWGRELQGAIGERCVGGT